MGLPGLVERNAGQKRASVTKHHGKNAGVIPRIKQWARALKRDVVALWFACKDQRTPTVAKALAVFTVSYALSPIDLIPDFIPLLGFVDDAIILPGLIWLVLRIVPADVMEGCRSKADEWLSQGRQRPTSRAGAALIIVVWLAFSVWLWKSFGGR